MYISLLIYYLCITFLRPIQGLFNDRIYEVTKIVDQNVGKISILRLYLHPLQNLE